MSKYIRYFNSNIELWATETLSSEELSQFQSAADANNIVWKSYQDRGLYTVKNVYETVYSNQLNTSIEIVVGQEITMASDVDLHSLALAPEWAAWMHRHSTETGDVPSIIQINS